VRWFTVFVAKPLIRRRPIVWNRAREDMVRRLLPWRCLHDLSKAQSSEGPTVSMEVITHLANEVCLPLCMLDRILRLLGKSCSRDHLIVDSSVSLLRLYRSSAAETFHRTRHQVPPVCAVSTTIWYSTWNILFKRENKGLSQGSRTTAKSWTHCVRWLPVPLTKFPRFTIFTQLLTIWTTTW